MDWSRRPLPEPWLEYAALDVEVLVEIRARLPTSWSRPARRSGPSQEFEHLLGFTGPPVRTDPWRRTSGMHKVRGRRGLAAVRELWETRDRIAEQRDVSPGRIIPDSSIVEAAKALPKTRKELLATGPSAAAGPSATPTSGSRPSSGRSHLPESELTAGERPGTTGRRPPGSGRTATRSPRRGSPRRARRSPSCPTSVSTPVENLLTPDLLRRLLWEPPDAVPATCRARSPPGCSSPGPDPGRSS